MGLGTIIYIKFSLKRRRDSEEVKLTVGDSERFSTVHSRDSGHVTNKRTLGQAAHPRISEVTSWLEGPAQVRPHRNLWPTTCPCPNQ